jgi:hypothetical protein
LRSRDGLEVDLVLEVGQRLHLFEMKTAMTITPRHASSLLKMSKELKSRVETGAVISRAKGKFRLTGKIMSYNWEDVLAI